MAEAWNGGGWSRLWTGSVGDGVVFQGRLAAESGLRAGVSDLMELTSWQRWGSGSLEPDRHAAAHHAIGLPRSAVELGRMVTMKTTAPTKIRFLIADDASENWRLRLEALENDPEAFSASEEEHRSLSLEEVRRRLGSQGGDQFVVGAGAGRPAHWNRGVLPREKPEDPS